METIEIGFSSLALGYILLICPLGIILWYKIPILNQTLIAIIRMTLQLLLVGLYLQVLFKLNNPLLNIFWLFIMILVADFSIVRGCSLFLKKFILPLFIALLVGTAIPLLFFLGLILRSPQLLDAQLVIPIGGMILGNCLRADIIGIKNFYENINQNQKFFLHTLAQGATLYEAVKPFLSQAFQAALMPTVATMATIGLVALPGMMTGVILGGSDPLTAIKYQIAIMISIFSGTAITILFVILLTLKKSFSAYGILKQDIFKRN